MSRAFRVRTATLGDASMILGWRNDPLVRASSRNTEIIGPSSHRDWLAEKIASPDSDIVIVSDQTDQPIGCVRFELRSTWAEVSIFLSPDFRGQGLGSGVLGAAQDHFRQTTADVDLLAYVMDDNRASQEMFKRAGYRLDMVIDGGQWYRLASF